MNILDLDVKHKFSPKLLTNINAIRKQFKDKFNIKYKDVLYPSKFIDIVTITNIKQTQLIYDEQLMNHEHTFKVTIQTDTVFIDNIHKTESLSGTTIMNMLIQLCKTLKVYCIFIYDGATVNGINLSLLKLVERNETYYMRFGFKFDVVKSSHHSYTCHEDVIRDLKSDLDKFRQLKVSEYLKCVEQILDILQSNNVIIYLFNNQTFQNSDIYQNKLEDRDNEISRLTNIRNELKNTDKIFVRDLMLNPIIVNDLTGDRQIVKYTSGNKSVDRLYMMNILRVFVIKNMYTYKLKL